MLLYACTIKIELQLKLFEKTAKQFTEIKTQWNQKVGYQILAIHVFLKTEMNYSHKLSQFSQVDDFWCSLVTAWPPGSERRLLPALLQARSLPCTCQAFWEVSWPSTKEEDLEAQGSQRPPRLPPPWPALSRASIKVSCQSCGGNVLPWHVQPDFN